VVLDRFSPILHLVQSIRDEAHRFAVTFHRSRRNARALTSELDQIPGVGAKTVTKLLKQFGSLELVRPRAMRNWPHRWDPRRRGGYRRTTGRRRRCGKGRGCSTLCWLHANCDFSCLRLLSGMGAADAPRSHR